MANVSRGLRCEGMEVFRLRELRNDCCPHSLGAKPVGDEPAAIERGATPPVGQGDRKPGLSLLRRAPPTRAAGTTVNVIDSSVSATAPFNGSVPQGQVNPNEDSAHAWKTLCRWGCGFNLGAISQAQAVLQAKGQRLVARSGLLPNVNAAAQRGTREAQPAHPGGGVVHLSGGRRVQLLRCPRSTAEPDRYSTW